MNNKEDIQRNGVTSPEKVLGRIFQVKVSVDFNEVRFAKKELEDKAPCCGSRVEPIRNDCSFGFGRVDRLNCVVPGGVVLQCSCGKTSYPSIESEMRIINIARLVRDFVDGSVNVRRENLLLYITEEDLGQIEDFVESVNKRYKKTQEKTA